MEAENQPHRLPRRVRRGRRIEFVGVACGAGAPDPGCGDAPETLRRDGIAELLTARGIPALWNETLTPDPAAATDSCSVVAGICERLALRVPDIVSRGALPVVLGGDHSCAVGTWKGLVRVLAPRGPVGLIWIDAHMDAHTPHTTPSGRPHGMPLACLLGHGAPALVNIGDGARLDPRHVCVIGVRSFEAGEASLLRRLGVRVIRMPEVRWRGLAAVMHEALGIAAAGSAGFGVTFDLDALDPRDAPGVGSPVPGGLRARELLPALAEVGRNDALAGVEIVEYNPHLDRDGKTGALVPELLGALLSPVRAAHPDPSCTRAKRSLDARNRRLRPAA